MPLVIVRHLPSLALEERRKVARVVTVGAPLLALVERLRQPKSRYSLSLLSRVLPVTFPDEFNHILSCERLLAHCPAVKSRRHRFASLLHNSGYGALFGKSGPLTEVWWQYHLEAVHFAAATAQVLQDARARHYASYDGSISYLTLPERWAIGSELHEALRLALDLTTDAVFTAAYAGSTMLVSDPFLPSLSRVLALESRTLTGDTIDSINSFSRLCTGEKTACLHELARLCAQQPPLHPLFHLAYAVSLCEVGRLQEASSLLEGLVVEKGNDPPLVAVIEYMTALLNLTLGERMQARQALCRAIASRCLPADIEKHALLLVLPPTPPPVLSKVLYYLELMTPPQERPNFLDFLRVLFGIATGKVLTPESQVELLTPSVIRSLRRVVVALEHDHTVSLCSEILKHLTATRNIKSDLRPR